MGKRQTTLESLAVIQFGDTFRGKRVVVTGHTGFKGSWLSFWLQELGAQVCGISLDPETRPNHWDQLDLDITDHRIDVRNEEHIDSAIKSFRPHIVYHLAAQPLVRRSYTDPLENWSTNVMGTANLLNACREIECLSAIVVITTDKVYTEHDSPRGFVENDRLGGHDPYSASKAACEILVDSYRKSFFNVINAPILASARAGNVIGGGDWSEDRLIPDLIRSMNEDKPLVIRSPNSTRPWQHVLDCISGYLRLGEIMLQHQREFGGAWNFGPKIEDSLTVEQVLKILKINCPNFKWECIENTGLHEAMHLRLDNSKATERLGWQPIWDVQQAAKFTIEWYRQFLDFGKVVTGAQLLEYIADASSSKSAWIQS